MPVSVPGEGSQRRGQVRLERMELVGFMGVKASLGGRLLVDERRECCDRLADLRPTQRPLIAVVVRRVDALGVTLDAGDLLNRAAVFLSDPRADDARQRAVIALNTHD